MLLVAGALAADLEYKAGIATAGQAKALVLEDRQGNRAVVAEASFAVTGSVSDFVAARLLQSYGLDRSAVLLRGVSNTEARPEDLVTAVAAALGKLEPAVVRFSDGALSVVSADGRCLAAIAPDASLAFDRCVAGDPVRGPIRAAFQMVEPAHGLLSRGAAPVSYPVQAIALGKHVTILSLGGEAPAARFRAKGRIVAPLSNGNLPFPDDARVEAAIRQVLFRVR